MSEAVVRELDEIHAKAVQLAEKYWPEVKKYARDYRATVISVMRFLIELEKLQVERAKGMRESMKMLERSAYFGF